MFTASPIHTALKGNLKKGGKSLRERERERDRERERERERS